MSHALTEKDILSSGLLAVKHMTMLYNDVASQTDDPQLVREMCEMINEEHHARIRIFETMRQRGWYNPLPIEEQQLRQAQQKLTQTSQAWSTTSPTQTTTSGWQQPQVSWPSTPSMGRPQQ